MSILMYMAIIIVGALISNKKLISGNIMKRLDVMQTLALLLMLFIMGISIGMDDKVISSFGTIGLKAVILALFSVIFSILGVYMISKKVFPKFDEEKREANDN